MFSTFNVQCSLFTIVTHVYLPFSIAMIAFVLTKLIFQLDFRSAFSSNQVNSGKH